MLARKVDSIRQAVDEAHRQKGLDTQVLICSDFNRHDTL